MTDFREVINSDVTKVNAYDAAEYILVGVLCTLAGLIGLVTIAGKCSVKLVKRAIRASRPALEQFREAWNFRAEIMEACR